MLNSSLTDFEVVKEFKKSKDQKYARILYERYLPLIKKFATRISFKGKDKERKKDFEQDAYFEIIKCLNITDIRKIPKEILNTWNFSSRYKFYLINLAIKYFKSYTKVNCISYDNESIEDISDNYSNYNCYNRKIIFNSIVEILDKTDKFSSLEKEVFFKKLEGETFVELQDRLQIAGSDYYFNKVLKYVKLKLVSMYGSNLEELFYYE